ncbi:LPS export ABC transporter ATP-binding protein [Geovibrio thiophilus]|uniref:Lipopolysaccharide export system ATP-binding protein LptB n=1 Tax=Geovibrio thiophilus TaxID=139438 RepID=A0A3R5UUP4_9BACT|nr:LPS export ABC transporter ATP-binding protein [Geovibrio thiophilus]QAR33049.1 LPS export ABC transporter ATP-binding protein [Geovibrio thiophilus]
MGLSAENLRKVYKKRAVVDGISLKVSKGEVVGLLGPNGAGKTTTFYMLTGIVKPDGGSVHLNGKDITRSPIHERSRAGIGYLPQEPSVFRKLSVYENIYAALELKNSDKSLIKETTERLIREFGLEKVRDSQGYSLSGGERRRVEIARCISAEPDVIMLDEPFSGIDPISVSDIQKMIFALKEMGLGVLITDHNVRETLKITDRAYIVADGKILCHGSPQEIVNNEEVISRYLGEGFEI